MAMQADKVNILVCHLDERVEVVKSKEVIVTHNPLSSLNAATTAPFGLIILDFSIRSSSRVRSEIIELCKCLKSNPLTRKIPLFASVDRWHREITGRMKAAGLDFIGVRQSQNRIDPEHIADLVLKTGISVNIDRIMERLCPFLNYEPINGCSELITCGAWHNRMVLGGKRLHDLCETENHLYCEHFLDPVPKS
ncbi:MAG: hypothetical protein JW882_04445 [Deltaproteobacteria bacterium]|nr:hypothetical protein [Deltaproteobacteria bacterium]